MLAIEERPVFDNTFVKWEYHTHKPYASSTLGNNDEIRIPISQQDTITCPAYSFLHITGKVSGKKTGGTTEATVKLVNNAMAFLFEDMRYEISGIEIDRTKNVGVTTTLKNILSIREQEKRRLKTACWLGPGESREFKQFTFSIPLNMLFGFFEDYKKSIINVKQELILLRAATNNNALLSADAATVDFEITDLYWRVPHATPNNRDKEKILRKIERNETPEMPFRSWELHEYPTLPQTDRISWTIKTSTQMEKPRFVVLAFQTDRKNNMAKDMSVFDSCKLRDVKLYLNSNYYPYDNIRGDKTIFYEMFADFQRAYYNEMNCPSLDYDEFVAKTPLYVIDCSHQDDTLKSGPVDVRLDFETTENFPAKTTAYCLLLHDSLVAYSLLTGNVKRMM